MRTYDWIVVGGGITGAALSYELAKIGFSVLLLEQDAISQNATRYSYGGIAHWSGTTPMTRLLGQEAIAKYQILAQELDADIQLRELDLLLTIPADHDPKILAQTYTNFATPPQLLSIQAACELEPLLNRAAISGALTVKHGHVHPEKTAQGYIQAMLRLGGEMQISQVRQLEMASNAPMSPKVVGVKTANSTFHSANVVVCAGGFSRKLIKSAGIPVKLFFTHTEIIEIPPVETRLNTLVMAANIQRWKLEQESTVDDHLWDEWDEQSEEITPPILDIGAVQFLDGSLRLGQISRTLANPDAKIDASESEKWLRSSAEKILPSLANLPGRWCHCLVGFSADYFPVIGALPGFAGLHVFSGFGNTFVLVPPLAARFAKFYAGKADEIISPSFFGR
jgi:glycine/D-amino acid oxidase-like deaminating enzyme